MNDEAPSHAPDPVLDPLRRALTLAKFQLVIGFLLMVGAPLVGRVAIVFSWIWCADNFAPMSNAGVINTDALAKCGWVGSDGDWLNVVHSIVSPPLLHIGSLFDVVGAIALFWFVLEAVTCWSLSKARKSIESPIITASA